MEDIYRSQFRMPWPLYEQLNAFAKANNRSLNSEVVTRLAISAAQSEAASAVIDQAAKPKGKQVPARSAPTVDQILDVLRYTMFPNTFSEREMLSAASRIHTMMAAR
ncbi:Arc family DNA-binding protein [Burkholderia gladioli]|uniref:Arc family DNA-binding protein n=1 Tax=Burkholderia gladioli TaxID=28095 RepID=UPI00163E107C|nr:Arc family DNA-binding protein [Burkholderia gladioli]